MIQLGIGKRIQGERKISIQICAKELNKKICAKELNKGLLKSLMETWFVIIKNIVIAITAVGSIMVKFIKFYIVVTSSPKLLSCSHFLFSFTNSLTADR